MVLISRHGDILVNFMKCLIVFKILLGNEKKIVLTPWSKKIELSIRISPRNRSHIKRTSIGQSPAQGYKTRDTVPLVLDSGEEFGNAFWIKFRRCGRSLVVHQTFGAEVPGSNLASHTMILMRCRIIV